MVTVGPYKITSDSRTMKLLDEAGQFIASCSGSLILLM